MGSFHSSGSCGRLARTEAASHAARAPTRGPRSANGPSSARGTHLTPERSSHDGLPNSGVTNVHPHPDEPGRLHRIRAGAPLHQGRAPSAAGCASASSSGARRSTASFTKLDPTFHDMVAFESTARETYARFRKGDSFVASGYVHEYEVDEPRRRSVIKEEFVARKIGHNVNKTDYVVQRGRHAAPERPLTAGARAAARRDLSGRRSWARTTSPTTTYRGVTDLLERPPESDQLEPARRRGGRPSSGMTSTPG